MPFSVPRDQRGYAEIKILGIGPRGISAVEFMLGNRLRGVSFVTVNLEGEPTRHLPHCEMLRWREVAESRVCIEADMVILVCGLGCRATTTAVAQMAREALSKEILTVVIAARPFSFEEVDVASIAERGVNELLEAADSVIIFDGDRLFHPERNPEAASQELFLRLDEAFQMGVKMVTEPITVPGIVASDFADVKTILTRSGLAGMGFGIAHGVDKASEAVQMALANPLFQNTRKKLAQSTGCLVWICGSEDIGIHDINRACTLSEKEVNAEANIIFCGIIDPNLPHGTFCFGMVVPDSTGRFLEEEDLNGGALVALIEEMRRR